ncbi:aBC transporter related protein [Corallococcus sp. CAG:1435]|nr:aBC transporter related protein [Corallococcus sp. CAG:1435]
MLLQVKSAEFRYGDVTIFKDVNLEVNYGENIGLVGANGAGKSTLLSCLAEEQHLFCGEIYKKSGLTLGYLRQNADFRSDRTLFDELMSVFDSQTQLLEKLNDTSKKMSEVHFDSQEYRALADKYHRLSVEADVQEAYLSEVKVKTVLNGMGMSQFGDRVVSTLSGGEKTKAALCKMLLQRPELMILDEPTNHLDYKTLDWLETFLSDRKSTLIVVSHDRYFLDKLCTNIWEVSHQRISCYRGNYTKYKQLKEEKEENQRRQYEKQQKEIAKLTDYIARNKVRASTADMAKSREKTLQKMQLVEVPQSEEKPPRFKFSCTCEPSEFPLTVNNLTLGYDGKKLLENVSFQLKRGQKMALLGLNGVGKSTLIRRIAQQNPYDLGKIIFGKNVQMGYYDQENLNLQGNLRVLDQLWFDNTRMSQTEVRSLLASVNLGADDVYKSVASLSGGERAKLGIAMIMAKDCNLLLLDEPTNHLDLPSREALERALQNYSGTVLFVSHDRYFVNSVATVIAEMADCHITLHDGNYDDFVGRSLQATQQNVASKPVSQTNYRTPKQRAEQTNRNRRIKELEKTITDLENKIADLENSLTDSKVIADYRKVQEVVQQTEEYKRQLDSATAQWEKLLEEQ